MRRREIGLIGFMTSLLLLAVLIPSAYGITVTCSSNSGGYSEKIGAAYNDAVKGSTVITAASLSHSIKGKGDLLESHKVSNIAGASAEVGVDIRKAEKYSYSYTLMPGSGSGWHAPVVTASELLDVDNADYIKAYATAHSATGDDASVDTVVTGGSLKGYSNTASGSANKAEASESGHILGTFIGTATAGTSSKTRTSNYGTEYDLSMGAKMKSGSPITTGTLGYYVEGKLGKTIQGAVDAALDGDKINVAEGKYLENVAIDKSLEINGAGAGKTIVDGSGTGSVITVGLHNPSADVALSGMTIQGGSGTLANPGLGTETFGGGILNYGTIRVINSDISGNTADFGGGIFNHGTATVINSDISGNNAKRAGGGIYNSWIGTLNVERSQITGNSAGNGNNGFYIGGGIFNYHGGIVTVKCSDISNNKAAWGGGIYNSGTMTVENSRLNSNAATYRGGGIFNDGLLKVKTSAVTMNKAAQGGGIFTDRFWESTTILKGSCISGNIADFGGGIYNLGTTTITNSKIFKNAAAKGGGIYNGIYSGQFGIHDGQLDLISGSICHNTATDPSPSGGGIYNLGTITGNPGIVHGNTPDQIAS
jgi:hypothetical protein